MNTILEKRIYEKSACHHDPKLQQIMERILLGIQESNKQLKSIRVTIENEKYVQKNGFYS